MSSDDERAFFARQPKLNGGRRYNAGETEMGSKAAIVHHGTKKLRNNVVSPVSWQEGRH